MDLSEEFNETMDVSWDNDGGIVSEEGLKDDANTRHQPMNSIKISDLILPTGTWSIDSDPPTGNCLSGMSQASSFEEILRDFHNELKLLDVPVDYSEITPSLMTSSAETVSAMGEGAFHMDRPEGILSYNGPISNTQPYLSISKTTTRNESYSKSYKQCELCPARFKRTHDLTRHIMSIHQQKRFECTDCDKKFTRANALRKHWEAQHRPHSVAQEKSEPFRPYHIIR